MPPLPPNLEACLSYTTQWHTIAARLALGARDNGMPGLRSNYHADYYAAFVIDPDGK